MFMRHWAWELLVLPADEFGGCCIQWPHGCSHGCCDSGPFVNFGWESCEFLLEVTITIVVKNEYFEQQQVQCQLQMTAQYYSIIVLMMINSHCVIPMCLAHNVAKTE